MPPTRTLDPPSSVERSRGSGQKVPVARLEPNNAAIDPGPTAPPFCPPVPYVAALTTPAGSMTGCWENRICGQKNTAKSHANSLAFEAPPGPRCVPEFIDADKKVLFSVWNES